MQQVGGSIIPHDSSASALPPLLDRLLVLGLRQSFLNAILSLLIQVQPQTFTCTPEAVSAAVPCSHQGKGLVMRAHPPLALLREQFRVPEQGARLCWHWASYRQCNSLGAHIFCTSQLCFHGKMLGVCMWRDAKSLQAASPPAAGGATCTRDWQCLGAGKGWRGLWAVGAAVA